MKTNAIRWIVTGMTFLMMLTSVMVSADVFIKKKHHQDEYTMMGTTQPAKDFVSTMWIAADRARNDMDNQSIIILLDKNSIIILDHDKKEYIEMPLNFEEAAAKAAKEEGASEEELAKLPAAIREMMKGAMKMNITITETNDRKVIHGWNCRKYNQKIEGMMSSESEVWASQDVKLDQRLYVKFSAAMMAMTTGLKDALGDIKKQMEKIKGMPVSTITTSTMMGKKMKSSLELLEVKDDAAAPPGIFEIPAGYKKGSLGR